MPSFEEATNIKKLSSHTYEAHFPRDWCIGTVPHGGFVTSCFMAVAREHFCGSLSRQAQPHTMSLHLEFMQRTEVGPALFTVKDIKLGRATSTLQLTLSQKGKDEVAGYLTNTNMESAQGLSIDTRWRLSPPTPPINFGKVDADMDPNWISCKMMPFRDFRAAAEHVQFFFPRQGQSRECAVVDQWVRFRGGQKFNDTSLGYVVDNFAQLIEVQTHEVDPYYDASHASKGTYWFPTLLLNLDIKKPLPEQGADWLFVRAQAKRIQKGRYDLEVIVMDESGDLVALSHHICMVLDATRNTTRRTNKLSGSKL